MYLFISGIVGIASMASIGCTVGIPARIEHFAALLLNESRNVFLWEALCRSLYAGISKTKTNKTVQLV